MKCRQGQFQCTFSGRCIPDVWVCDGELDCGTSDSSGIDSTDEDAVKCTIFVLKKDHSKFLTLLMRPFRLKKRLGLECNEQTFFPIITFFSFYYTYIKFKREKFIFISDFAQAIQIVRVHQTTFGALMDPAVAGSKPFVTGRAIVLIRILMKEASAVNY